ncbi:prealbumin-like fold domain-containing protein [Enterococcus sp. LJL99]
MNKKKSYLAAVLIMTAAILYFFCSDGLLQAKSDFRGNHDLFFSVIDSDESINELAIMEQEKIEVKLHNTNQELNEVGITIPDELNFDLVETQKLIEQVFPTLEKKDGIVSVDGNKIKLQFSHPEINLESIPLVFSAKQFSSESQNSSKLIATANLGGKEYQSQEVELVIPKNNNEHTIQPRAGDLNVDLHLESVYSSIEAGADGIFQLNFKVTGSQASYQDATIEVKLPDNALFDQDIEQLKLADVTPTYDEQTHALSYFFKELNSGVSFTQLFKVQTENGFVKNGTKLKASAEFKAPNYFENTYTEAMITVASGLTMSANKEYVRTYYSNGVENDEVPQEGNIGEWQVRVNIPKKDTGQLYIQEESQIIITDQLPKGLAYVEGSTDGTYDAKNHTLTWLFDAPDLEEQERMTTELFTSDFTVRTKFPDKLTKIESYTNNLSVSVVDINGETIEEQASAAATVFPPSSNVIPPVNGTLLYPTHFGPLNGKGDISNDTSKPNPNPTVYNSATLGFSFESTPMQADSPNKPFDSYDVTYKIDDHLDLKNIYLQRPRYAPNYTYYSNNLNQTLSDSAAQMELYGMINGKEQLLIKNPESLKYYNLEELGIDEHISQLRFHYTYRAAGTGQSVRMRYSIQEGYFGQVKNSYGFNYTGYNKNGTKVSQSQSVNGTPISQYAAARTANVIKAPTDNSIPIVSNTINYETEENGTVISGPNRVHGTFKSDPSSLVTVKGSFDTYVLLSQGVKLDTENPDGFFSLYNGWTPIDETEIKGTVSIKDENYLGQERQLLHVHWDYDTLDANDTLTYNFNINVGDDASSLLMPEAYSFLGNATFKVPTSTGNSITDSVIQNDINDINGNGVKNEKMVKTGNQYYLANASGVVIQELVKGELDEDFSMFGHTVLDGDIHYRFEFTNKGTNKISTMTLMNVLPSVGDLGITDNQPLDSMFTPLMKGPIDLPDEWDDKVEVYYSEAMNPKRDDLNDSVNYPSTTQPIPNPVGAQDPKWMKENDVDKWEEIHSFMIKMKQGESWEATETMTLDFDMKAPDKLDKELIDPSLPEYDRAAWNSFAFTVNGLQAVEPSKVGVVVNNEFNLQMIKEDDEESSKRLAGAEFTFFDQEKTELDTQTTNEQGELQFMGIAPGTYYIQETKAPPFYELNPTVYEVEINNKGEITLKNPDEFVKQTENANEEAQIKLVVSNRLKRLPNTGSKKLITLLIGGVLLVAVGIGYLIKRNQERGRSHNETK